MYFGLLLIVTGFVLGLCFGQNTLNQSSFIKLGVSQINITPEKPTLMGGYSARTTPFTGVHDALYASALYFTGDESDALLITAD